MSDAAGISHVAPISQTIRGVRGLIQQQIENPLAKRILAGDFAPGDAIEISANGEAYAFTKTEPVLEGELVN